MKRLPLLLSFLLFILLCISGTYWALQLFKPPLRPVAAPPVASVQIVKADAAGGLFGGRHSESAVAAASNYQLRGVVFSGHEFDSVAILSVDGKPAQAMAIDKEISPGVTVKEVHRDYVLLSDNGVTKRVDLPESAKMEGNVANRSQVGTAPQSHPQQSTQQSFVPPPPGTPGQTSGSSSNATQTQAGQAQNLPAQQGSAQQGMPQGQQGQQQSGQPTTVVVNPPPQSSIQQNGNTASNATASPSPTANDGATNAGMPQQTPSGNSSVPPRRSALSATP